MTMKRPNEFEYASHVSYTRALEEYCNSLEKHEWVCGECVKCGQSIERPEQEPVAKVVSSGEYDFPMLQWLSANHSLDTEIGSLLYTSPPKREWVGFTDDERSSAIWTDGSYGNGFINAEKKLMEKNK